MEASFVKYGVNSFLASKVLWFNQFKDLVDRNDSRYSVVANAVGYDERIGKGHTKVPGFDGKKGFGGSCFPKDTLALVQTAKTHNIDLSIVKTTIGYNQKRKSKMAPRHPL